MPRRPAVSLLIVGLSALPLLQCTESVQPSVNAMSATDRRAADAIGIVTQLSTGSADNQQNQPAISGTNVVWTNVGTPSGGPSNFDIYFYDIATGGAINLTNSPNDQEFLEDIDGSKVVWTRATASVPGDIEVYDLAANTLNTIAASSSSVAFQQPSIHGSFVAFLRVSSQVDVFLYNLTTGSGHLVTGDVAIQSRPRVGGSVVVYEDYGAGNADVRATPLGGGSSFVIAGGPGDQVTPDVDGNTVVYIDHASGTDQLFAFDLNAGTARQLTTVASSKILPRISGSRVIWSDDRNGNLDLYTFDLVTGTESPLVTGVGDQFLSDIDGDRVVYTDNASGFEQVFMFVFTSAPPPPPEPQTKDDCKKDGWRRFGFRNQGQCVSFVVSRRGGKGP